tara:strand:- start:35 stop:244 length:210 start_codon:yes stop_codon:yes gene_type:complete
MDQSSSYRAIAFRSNQTKEHKMKTDKTILESKLERLEKRRRQAIKEKDNLLALDLELRIERTKAKIEKL